MLLTSLEQIRQYIEENGIRHFSIFTDNFACPCCGAIKLNSEVIEKLDILRANINLPVIITSACRCEEHNERVGGKKNSEHLVTHENGTEGVDIEIPNSHYRHEVLRVNFEEQLFNRIGIAHDFMHLGISLDHPKKVTWLY